MKSCLVVIAVFSTLSVIYGQSEENYWNRCDGNVRLRDGCSGVLHVCCNGFFVNIVDPYFSSRSAQVACRQVGCEPDGARTTTFGFHLKLSSYITRGYRCLGSESSLDNCTDPQQSIGESCSHRDVEHRFRNLPDFVKIQCGPMLPTVPRLLSIKGISVSAFYITWGFPLNRDGLMGYEVNLTTTEGEHIFTNRLWEYRQTIRDVNLTESTTYIVTVRAENDLGFGPAAIANGSTLSLASPQAILDAPVISNITATTAILSWIYPGGNVSNFSVNYNYYYARDRGNFTSVSGTETSVELVIFRPGTGYWVRIAVLNENGRSFYSPTSRFTTLTVPTTVPPTTHRVYTFPMTTALRVPPATSSSPPVPDRTPVSSRNGEESFPYLAGVALGILVPIIYFIVSALLLFRVCWKFKEDAPVHDRDPRTLSVTRIIMPQEDEFKMNSSSPLIGDAPPTYREAVSSDATIVPPSNLEAMENEN